MLRSIDIIAVGKMKAKSIFAPAFEDYKKRMSCKVSVIELDGRSQEEELQKISGKIAPSSPLVVLDETGTSLCSKTFSQKIRILQEQKNTGSLQFVIGGADGLSKEILDQADIVMSFGRQTWPHMMVRVMLMEQIYRAQQILSGHPYHRA